MTQTQPIELSYIYAIAYINNAWNTVANVSLRIEQNGLSWSSQDFQLNQAVPWSQVATATTLSNLKDPQGLPAWSIELKLTTGYQIRFLVPEQRYSRDWAQSVDSYLNYYKALYPTQITATTVYPSGSYSAPLKPRTPGKSKSTTKRTPFLLGAVLIGLILIVVIVVLVFNSGSPGLSGPPTSYSPNQIASDINLTTTDLGSQFKADNSAASTCYSINNPWICGTPSNVPTPTCLNQLTLPGVQMSVIESPSFSFSDSTAPAYLIEQDSVVIAKSSQNAASYFQLISTSSAFKCFQQQVMNAISIFSSVSLSVTNTTILQLASMNLKCQSAGSETDFTVTVSHVPVSGFYRIYLLQAGRLIVFFLASVVGNSIFGNQIDSSLRLLDTRTYSLASS